MENLFRSLGLAGRALALTTVFGAGVAAVSAQTAASTPTLNLDLPTSSTSAIPAFSSSSSSSTDNDLLAANVDHMNFTGVNPMQYGGRSRSGRPRYRGGNTNADGSEKYFGFAGVGVALPSQDTETYNTPSWAFGVGAGRNFNKHAGVQLEFNYDHFGLKGSTLANQTNLYNYGATAADAISGLDGDMHDWSFVLSPVYNIYSGEGLGAYITAGAGFYHKVTNFTLPEEGEECDYYYGCYDYEANAIVDHYSSNAAGLDGGIGLTYKFSRFSNERFFIEGRYVYTFNQYRPGVTSASSTTTLNAYNGYNLYPQNSLRTSYFPIKVGIRF